MRTILALFLLSGSVWATDWYVSPSGNNGNPGTQSQPFRQISAAVAVAQPVHAALMSARK